MNDWMKTLVYACIAAGVSMLAFFTYPKLSTETAATQVGKSLFDKFTDPLAARSIEIVSLDEARGIESLKVEQNVEGNWVIPSKDDYPADAADQLKNVANSLLNLTVYDVASTQPEDHAFFGVVAPDPAKTKAGDKDVGRLLKISDAEGRALAALVIGRPERGNPKRRFVRIPNQDLVYVVDLELDKIKSRFEDWIEKDLLKLDPTQIERVIIKDYSVVPTNVGKVLDPRMEADLKFDSTANKWSVNEIVTFRRGARSQSEPVRVPSGLSDTEELNSDKLNQLKTALDTLQIVDVVRKPRGLSRDLKADQSFANDNESLTSLEAAGFHFTATGDIRSANGEIVVGLKDGVDYVLRFGGITGAEGDASDLKLNRYMFAMATFDESRIPAPSLEPEPQEPPPAPNVETRSQDGNGGACQEPASDDNVEGNVDTDKSDDPNTTPKTAVDAERERIKQSNERKMNEYRDRKKKAVDKVADLNDRFADWYYVISEDTYKKIRMGRADIIREATQAKEEGFGIDAYRKLEREGLRSKSTGGSSSGSTPISPLTP